MRAEYTLALRRESEEFEQAMVERRVEQAFEHVYEVLVPASSELRNLLTQEGQHVFEQIERAYLQAIEFAARSGIGSQAVRRNSSLLRAQRSPIPLAPAPKVSMPVASPATADHDQVINVRPCG
jgi:hypothetical protein